MSIGKPQKFRFGHPPPLVLPTPPQYIKRASETEFGILVSKLLGFETFRCFFMVSVSVSKIFGIGKSFGIGFEKIWYRKKYRYWYRKNFGIEKSIGIGIEKNWYRKKVSVSVSKKIGIGKKYRYRYRSDFGFRHTLWASNLS